MCSVSPGPVGWTWGGLLASVLRNDARSLPVVHRLREPLSTACAAEPSSTPRLAPVADVLHSVADAAPSSARVHDQEIPSPAEAAISR